jgi:hypothetical protein
MTVQESVAALNHYRHNGHAGWYASTDTIYGGGPCEEYTIFEAEALAHWYERGGSPRPKQPTITGITLVPRHHGPVLPGHPFGDVMQTYSVQASVIGPDVASRSLSTALNGGAPAVAPLAAGFTCAIGDTFVLILTDTGTDGVASLPSAPFTGTAAAPPVGPAQPTITGVTLVSSAP